MEEKKLCQPLLLADELDYHVQEYIKEHRTKHGLPINTVTGVVVPFAQGIA